MKRRKEYENSNYTAFLISCSKLLALGIKGILIVAGIAGDGMNQPGVLDVTVSNDDEGYRDTSALLHNFSAFSNNLINLSASLLAILTTLSQQKDPQNLPELHQYLVAERKPGY